MNSVVIYYFLFSIILFEAILWLVALSNLWFLKRLGSYPPSTQWPGVSVLVPARNEEANIGPCVESLLAQQYPNFEVLVLDDNSTDDTWQILTQLAAEHEQLKIIKGRPLPIDWLGKHWACHQLAQAAMGELLLFTDADTRHQPSTLRDSVSALQAEKADMLTALPHEEVVTWGEQLVVPLIIWSIFAIVPVALAHRLRYAVLSATIGQFMLFRRRAYHQIGGFKAVRQQVVDDIALGRLVKAHGYRWRLVDGTQQIHCRMYHNFQQVYQGLAKNLFAAFSYKIPHFLFVWFWLGFVFWGPLILIGLAAGGVSLPAYALHLSGVAIIMTLLLWGITYRRFRFPLYLTPLYPVTILLGVVIALNSMVLTLTNRATWKGRRLVRPKIS